MPLYKNKPINACAKKAIYLQNKKPDTTKKTVITPKMHLAITSGEEAGRETTLSI